MLTPRPYQRETLDGITRLLDAGVNRPAVVQATGLGKTVTFSLLIKEHLERHPGQRALVLVGRDELAEQARDTIHAAAPHLRPGIVMGTRRDYDRQVVVASVPTLSRARMRHGITSFPRREQIHGIGLTVVDECHHAAADSWRRTMEYYGAWQQVPTVGFTATMSREDNRGLGEIWQRIVERPDGGVWDTQWGIRNGYLCDVRGLRIQVPALDLSNVRVRGGDLMQEETAHAMLDANTGEAIVKAIHTILTPEYGQRRGTVFAPNVETALDFAAAMNDSGLRTGTILGSTPRHERAQIYAAFEAGRLDWLTNAMVLTEGWDAPWCDSLVIARPTKSAGLYQQMVGRGLRTFPGKRECVLLDVCGVTETHGLASLTDLSLDRKIKPKDGQSLLEAIEEYEEIGDRFEVAPPPVHKVVGREVDLFAGSRSVWLRTRAGTWFVPAADRLFFLWPDGDGRYLVASTTKATTAPARKVHDEPLDLELALSVAETMALEYAPDHAGRNAPWRQSGPAKPGQRRDLEAWGLPVPRRVTAAAAYDALNVEMATRRLDVRT